MKTIGKALVLGLLALSLVALCQGPAARAQQSRDLKLISAVAGGVNFTTGAVEFKRRKGKAWETLTTKDDLRSGDTVRTGADGRVEILLNPGSYFRAGENTEFALVDSSLDDLRLSLSRGAAVVEATGYEEAELSIVVTTPQARVRIIRTGIYRVSALTGMTELTVEKGRAYVGEDEALLVKGGRVVRVGSGPAEVAKYDKRTRDALDLWSRERGKELAKVNDRLSRRDRSAMLASLAFDPFYSAASGGFWYRNVTAGCYTFVPYYTDWRSPYGFGYGSYFPSYYVGGCGGCNRRPYYDNGVNPRYNPGYIGGTPPDNGGNSGYNQPGRGSNPGVGNPGPPAGGNTMPRDVTMPRETNAERGLDRMVNKSREP
ncbi:MAG TPA: FecR family protein [Pyrinomonadaceae bacterium]|jgi:hypothetical protein|nr:FecR family protein [Pyrinomonadaceae bacterium]